MKITKKPVVEMRPAISIADQIRPVLQAIGEDPKREGLIRTPERFEKALRFITSG